MREFLDFLHPTHGITELRCMRDGKVKQEWFARHERQYMIEHVEEYSACGWDAYVGVLPRVTASGRAEDCWPTTTVLWADVDDKHHGGSHDKAIVSILGFPLTPSCINDSGHGFHVFWALDAAVPFKEAEWAMRGIARWIGGDAVYDAPRVLRLPGTLNHKDPQNPVPVRLLKLDHLRKYDLSDFAEMVASLDRPEREYVQTERRQDAPDWLKDLLNEEPPKGLRSETEFRAGLWLARYGYSDDDILTILMNSPVGAKAQERGERWAEQEVARIRRQA